MKIYFSSTTSQKKNIHDVISFFINHNIRNIELTGGLIFEKNMKKIIMNYKKKHNINFILHNYFPIPKNNFMLNLASLDNTIYFKSINLCKSAIDLSRKINSYKYAVHAGYLIDFSIKEAGKLIFRRKLNSRKLSIERFCEAWVTLKKYAGRDVDLYIENNALSQKNFLNFKNNNPFLLTEYESFIELSNLIDFKILLDVGHLYVSCNTLKFDFDYHLKNLISKTDYIHFSENDGYEDQNRAFSLNNIIYRHLIKNKLDDKIITLEINDDFKKTLMVNKNFLNIN